MNLPGLMRLMRQYWAPAGKTRGVLEGYRVLGANHRHTLADIALRNGVFRYEPPGAAVFDRGVAEGRRQAALEIFALASVDAAALYALIETKPSPQERK